ncbi:uridylate kinase [uncultured Desulfobacterium sp.]|uniref:Uridylate kinase n=1 Tax=uncultured Desulfobacterium sp. TaxID=201089 RepID=A0A445N225_9BACT|nr:uridylate kinase [uncultured Desulfobacterium sp.]
MNDIRPIYKRVLLKLSGEALAGKQSFGIDPTVLQKLASEILMLHRLGVEIGIVVGGGNIFRGLKSDKFGVGRVAGDHMGMLATVINSIALGEALKRVGIDSRVMTGLDINKVAEPYIREKAITHLSNSRIIIFGAGTGNPFFTTDTAATLRALEVDAQVLMKATNVDGVYDADPRITPSARPFSTLTYTEVLEKGLKVMDLTAVSLAMDEQLPIIVFNMAMPGNILKAVSGEKVGTLITGE